MGVIQKRSISELIGSVESKFREILEFLGGRMGLTGKPVFQKLGLMKVCVCPCVKLCAETNQLYGRLLT